MAVALKRTFADFFAGIGLMRLGLEQAGWRIAYANDISEEKHSMYKAHFDDAATHYIVDDVHRVRAEDVPAVALATASFPCNDLSLAGAREGLRGKQSSAYWGFISVLHDMGNRRPPIVLLENVTGFLTSRGGKDFESALLALNELGYSVDSFTVNAREFVPQSRERLFVVGMQLDSSLKDTSREPLAFYESDVRPLPMADFIFRHPGILWNIRKLPSLPKGYRTLSDVLEDVPSSSDLWWSDKRSAYLVSQMSEKHHKGLSKMRYLNEWSYATVFRRVRKGTTMAELRTDGIAGCLRTPRGGSARQILLKAGYGQVHVRLLTPRECARLMGADNYRITTSANRALFGFGDAVCVPVVSWIARNYLNPLFAEIVGTAVSQETREHSARSAVGVESR